MSGKPDCGGMAEKKCRHCGKRFFVPNTAIWAYKFAYDGAHSAKWFCSWHCITAWRRAHEKPQKLKGGDGYAI